MIGIRWLSLGCTWLAACGGSGHPATDAAAVDGAVDAAGLDSAVDAAEPDSTIDGAVDSAVDAAPDAPPRPVTIHTLGRDFPGTGPRAGVVVLFHAPDGALVGRTTTDARGDATGDVPDGGSVTVVEDAERTLSTIMGVTGGDELWIGDHGWAPPLRHATVVVPPGPDAGDEYVIYGPCVISGNSPSPVDIHLFQCTPASGPLGVAAYRIVDSSTWILRGWLYNADVSLVENGTATMTGAWQPPLPLAVHLTGAPADVGWTINVGRIAGGERIAWFQSGSLSSTAGKLDTQLSFSGGGDGLYSELWMQPRDGGHRQIFEYRSGTPTSIEGDVAGDLITRPIEAQWTTGELSPGGPTGVVGLHLTTSGAGDYDGIVARAEVADDEFRLSHWSVVMPPVAAGSIDVRLPTLPPDLVDLWANRTDGFSYVVIADTPATSYAEFRRDAEPEHRWSWMRHPLTPTKVRISTSY